MLLREFLVAKGYDAYWFPDSKVALQESRKTNYDICIIDTELPEEEAFNLAEHIKGENSLIPIVFLSSKDTKADMTRCFRMGADDYVTKPFSVDELTFRIEAILRRMDSGSIGLTNTYKMGKCILDTRTRILTIGKKEKRLTAKENALLGYLCAYSNGILERDVALRKIWGDANYYVARSMDVYITRLRKLLKDDPSVEIANVHGRGYRLITLN